MDRSWEEVVTAKRLERDALIEKHHTPASEPDSHMRITDVADVDILTKLIESEKITAESVIRGYVQK